jgi:2-keto-4-pentenoate hydratase
VAQTSHDDGVDDDSRNAAALMLAEAERNRIPIPPLTETFAGLDAVDAYQIQLLNIQRRLTSGHRLRGHKVGLTAKVMQDMLGVNEPDYGHLLDDMFVGDGEEVAAGRFLQPKVEVEIGFILGQPLQGPNVTVDDVMAATESVVPAIEIIDSRIADWKITLADTIADNASSAALVLGREPVPITGFDLTSVEATLLQNGEVVATGPSTAVLGNPAAAVAWAANKLADFDTKLLPGHVILPGSCTRAIAVRPGDRFEARLSRLGSVSVRFS